jgi:site-specific recombinase XerD
MSSAVSSLATEQIRDLDRIAVLWQKLGHTPGSVRVYRQQVGLIISHARVTDYRQLCAERVEQLARTFATAHHHQRPERTRWLWLSAFRAFAWGLRQMGKEVGATDLPKRGPPPEPLVIAFLEHGQKLGCAPQTLHAHLYNLGLLRRYLIRRRGRWPVPPLLAIDRFLQHVAPLRKATTVAAIAGSCRAWYRFLFITGRAKHDLAESITLPRFIAYPRPARALPWSSVRQLGRGIARDAPLGRRDYAQYVLFCAYGLSTAEIRGLQLEQIDWDAGIIHIRRAKNGATVDLPLLPGVARAIATYLHHGRPAHASSREVFVRHTIPFGPLGHATIGQRVRCWAERAHVRSPFLGAHLFRHSFATRQLEHGTPLKIIGDILGHRSSQTTSIYVRTALARLRRLALPVPK